jgi:hypothetical protein
MNADEQRTHRTVTQTLGARLDDVEVVTERNSRNGEALYAGHESNAQQIALLMDRVQALSEQQDALRREFDYYARERGAQIEELQRVLRSHLRASFWHRLRWLVTGVLRG